MSALVVQLASHRALMLLKLLHCWTTAVKVMANVDQFIARLKNFKPLIDKGEVPQKSVDACRSYLALPHFNR